MTKQEIIEKLSEVYKECYIGITEETISHYRPSTNTRHFQNGYNLYIANQNERLLESFDHYESLVAYSNILINEPKMALLED